MNSHTTNSGTESFQKSRFKTKNKEVVCDLRAPHLSLTLPSQGDLSSTHSSTHYPQNTFYKFLLPY